MMSFRTPRCASRLSAAEREAFRVVVSRIIEENSDVSAPEIVEKIKKLNFGCGMEIMLQKRWKQEDQFGEKHSSPGER